LGMLLSRRGRHPLRWGLAAADRMEIRSMAKPALSFMAFPLAMNLLLVINDKEYLRLVTVCYYYKQ